MPTVFGLNRQRAELTGLEEPDELWERLKEAMAQASALAANNKKLASRVRLLERRLAEAGGLTDDELVAELPKRMSRALESAQGVATEIVRRAKRSEAVIRSKAEESAAAIVRKAEADAAAIVAVAADDASARMADADAQAREIIEAAHARREEVLGELETEATALRQRIKVLQRSHARLTQAFDVVERSLADARAVLGPKSAPVLEPAPLPGPRSGQSDDETARFRVYDWSPASQAG